MALHRLGAILIPCSYQMAAKDLVYRINAAEVKLLIAVEDPWVLQQVEESRGQCPTLENIALVGAPREGWLDFSRGLEEADDSFIIDSTLTAEDP